MKAVWNNSTSLRIKMIMSRNIFLLAEWLAQKGNKTNTTKQLKAALSAKHNRNCYNRGRFTLRSSCSCCSLTVNRTKNLWFFSPTQLFTQGQWWSIFRIHRLQILKEKEGKSSVEKQCIVFWCSKTATGVASGHMAMCWNLPWQTANSDFICISLQKRLQFSCWLLQNNICLMKGK